MIEMVVPRCWGAKRLEDSYHSIHSCRKEVGDAGQELEVPEEGLDSHIGNSPTHWSRQLW